MSGAFAASVDRWLVRWDRGRRTGDRDTWQATGGLVDVVAQENGQVMRAVVYEEFQRIPHVPGHEFAGTVVKVLGSHGMAAATYGPMLAEIAAGSLQPQRLVRDHIGLGDVPGRLAAGRASTTWRWTVSGRPRC